MRGGQERETLHQKHRHQQAQTPHQCCRLVHACLRSSVHVSEEVVLAGGCPTGVALEMVFLTSSTRRRSIAAKRRRRRRSQARQLYGGEFVGESQCSARVPSTTVGEFSNPLPLLLLPPLTLLILEPCSTHSRLCTPRMVIAGAPGSDKMSAASTNKEDRGMKNVVEGSRPVELI